jgi:hypothetical protein
VAAAAVAGAPLVRSGHRQAFVVLGAAALLMLALGLLLRVGLLLVVAVALLGAEHTVRLATGPAEVDPWTPVYAAGFVLAAEFAWWSIEPRVPAWTERGLALRRLAVVAAVCAGSAALAALVVLTAGARLGGGLGIELVGVGAAAGVLSLVALLSRRSV